MSQICFLKHPHLIEFVLLFITSGFSFLLNISYWRWYESMYLYMETWGWGQQKNLWNCKSFSLYTRMYKYLMCNNSIFHGDYLINYWCVNSYNVQSAFYGCNKSTYCFWIIFLSLSSIVFWYGFSVQIRSIFHTVSYCRLLNHPYWKRTTTDASWTGSVLLFMRDH